MAEERMAAVDVVCKAREAEFDFLREAVRRFVHELMEEEVTAVVGAGRYERSDERITQRNGVRHRQWDMRVGTLDLAIPKLRTGMYFPGWLEPRRRSEQALVTVVGEAYLLGVSTRRSGETGFALRWRHWCRVWASRECPRAR